MGIELRLANTARAPSEARARLRALEPALPRDLVDDVALLVSELVANSVLHAGLGPDASVGMRVVATASRVRVEVRDAGPGFAPRPAAPGLQRTSGRGLFIVDRIADRWGVERGRGACVWFEIDRRDGAEPMTRR